MNQHLSSTLTTNDEQYAGISNPHEITENHWKVYPNRNTADDHDRTYGIPNRCTRHDRRPASPLIASLFRTLQHITSTQHHRNRRLLCALKPLLIIAVVVAAGIDGDRVHEVKTLVWSVRSTLDATQRTASFSRSASIEAGACTKLRTQNGTSNSLLAGQTVLISFGK